MLAATLVTAGRHQINQTMFEEWSQRLASFRSDVPDFDHKLHHETCLWSATALDYQELRNALLKWDVSNSEPVWMMRKSALLFEAGLDDEARNLVDSALSDIREHPWDDKTLSNPSREGWALWLALKRDDLFSNPVDAVRKWEELAVLKCNANVERDRYADALKEHTAPKDPPPFDLGIVRENLKFSSTGYYRYLAAYRAIGVTEQAGLPPAQGGVAIASNMLGLAAEALAPHEPAMSARLVLRITTYDKDKRFNSILSRTGVASMPVEVVNALARDMVRAIEFAVPKSFTPKEDRGAKSWIECLRVFMEALSRFVVRVDEQMVMEVFDKALIWYANSDIAMHPWMPEPVRHVLSRSWETLTEPRRKDRLQALLSAPIAGVDGFVGSGVRYPDPGHLLMGISLDVNRTDGDQNRWTDIVRFLARAMQQSEDARKRASIRMFWLVNCKLFTSEEEREAIDAFWGVDFAAKDYLPEETAVYDWVFLTIPEPEDGIAEKRFRLKWLNTSMDLDEIRDELFKTLWQVGMAIRGLRGRGQQLHLSQEERNHLATVVAAWSQLPRPKPVGHSVSGEPQFFGGRETEDRAIEGLKAILLEIDLPYSDATVLHEKIQLLRGYGVRTMCLSAGLVKVLPAYAERIVHNMRMALASDNERLASDAVLGLWYWLQIVCVGRCQIVTPPVDLVREIGVIIATRRKAALAFSLQVAKWVFTDGHDEQRRNIGELASQGLGFLIGELRYELRHDPDFDVPLLRWGCTHLAIAMTEHGFDKDQNVAQWVASAQSDPLPEVRHANRPDEPNLLAF